MRDIEIYRAYIKDNAKRAGEAIANIPAMLVRLDARLVNPKFKNKHKRYKAEKLQLEAVLRVEND